MAVDSDYRDKTLADPRIPRAYAPNDRIGSRLREWIGGAERRSKAGATDFHSFFDTSESVVETVVRGHWDFCCHILTPRICEAIDSPIEKVALEIGYGGGRLMNAACAFFRNVIGVDIHGNREAVEAFLRANGKTNFALLRGDGSTIDVESESIDFVYSFIVMQHLVSIQTLAEYIEEIRRCLKPGGIAQIYVGRLEIRSSRNFRTYWKRGFEELAEPCFRNRSLVLSRWRARRMFRERGFQVLETGTSYKKVPDGFRGRRGGQTYVTARRPGP